MQYPSAPDRQRQPTDYLSLGLGQPELSFDADVSGGRFRGPKAGPTLRRDRKLHKKIHRSQLIIPRSREE